MLTCPAVYRDVENIEPLTKLEMLEFFRTYYHPHSIARAKASVHLIARASAADLAAKTSSAEKRDRLVETISQMLEQLGLEDMNAADLNKRMEKVDLASADTVGIMEAVGSYLRETAGMAVEQIEKVVEQGQAALVEVLPSLGIVSQSEAADEGAKMNGEAVTNGDGHESKTLLIEDAKAFKASMPLSAGTRPVRDLSEFEEIGAKL